MFKGNIDVEKGRIFSQPYDSGYVNVLVQAVAVYDACCDMAREMCVTWVLVAKRIGYNKDVRRMISKMVWETRREGELL